MNREELRTRIITYCDYCGKELRPPYTTIKCKDGRELDFCSDYVEGERNCRQKFEEDGKTTPPPPAEGAEQRIRVRNILQDFYRRGEYELEQAEEDIMRLFQPQPTAEGAEEILDRLAGEFISMKGDYADNVRMQSCYEREFIIKAITEFATLHAQKIADKMVSERLRGYHLNEGYDVVIVGNPDKEIDGDIFEDIKVAALELGELRGLKVMITGFYANYLKSRDSHE